MITNTYVCDGCEKKLDEHEIEGSLSQSTGYAEKCKAEGKDFTHVWNLSTGSPLFHFCHVCQVSAEDYWDQFPDFYRSLISEITQRVSKNRLSFFQSRKAKSRSGTLRAVQ